MRCFFGAVAFTLVVPVVSVSILWDPKDYPEPSNWVDSSEIVEKDDNTNNGKKQRFLEKVLDTVGEKVLDREGGWPTPGWPTQGWPTAGWPTAGWPTQSLPTPEPVSSYLKVSERSILPRKIVAERNASLRYQLFLDHFPMTRMLNYSQTIRTPKLWKQFDWVVGLPECNWTATHPKWHHGHAKTNCSSPDRRNPGDPNYVFVHPWLLTELLGTMEHEFPPNPLLPRERTLVVGWSDWNITFTAFLSEITPEQLIGWTKRHFSTIFWEAHDIDIGGVKTMPKGLTEHYFHTGPGNHFNCADAAMASMSAACLNDKCKTGNILGGHGKYSKGLEHCYSQDQKTRGEFACESREALDSWGNTSTALSLGYETVNPNKTEPVDWWGTLASYRFLVSPLGAGITAPKTVEALFVLTIPIVQRFGPAHDNLKKMGFPLVIVDKWDEITDLKLKRWWKNISPRLVSFRQNCLLTETYWKFISGQIDHCY